MSEEYENAMTLLHNKCTEGERINQRHTYGKGGKTKQMSLKQEASEIKNVDSTLVLLGSCSKFTLDNYKQLLLLVCKTATSTSVASTQLLPVKVASCSEQAP